MIAIWIAWFRERMTWRVFVPAIGALALAACWAADAWTASEVARSALLTAALVLQFRLWDDSEDCARDASSHPARVMVRAGTRVFVPLRLGLTMATLTATLAVGTGRAATVVAALDIVAWLAYRAIRPAAPDLLWRYGALLLKYPAFVMATSLALGTTDVSRLWLAATAAYLAAATYESAHTPHAFQENV